MLISYKKPRGRFFVVGGKAQPVVEWTVTVTAGANGSVSVDGVPGDYLETVPGGTVLTIEAEADTDYEFTQWSDGNTDNPRTLTVDSDISLSASFQEAAPQFKHFYVEDTSGNDNTLSITDSTQSNPTEVFKSTDRVSWTSMGTTSSTPITATVPANGRLYLKASTSAMDRNRMTCSSDYKVGGQAASLLFGDNYINSALGPTNNGAFRDLRLHIAHCGPDALGYYAGTELLQRHVQRLFLARGGTRTPSHNNGTGMLQQYVQRLHLSYCGPDAPSCDAGTGLLLRNVQRLHRHRNGTSPSSDDLGPGLLLHHVRWLHKPDDGPDAPSYDACRQLLPQHVRPL